MKLVVVESPSKAGTIKKYLGKDYIVKASKGHVVDLPKSKLGVDPEKNFKPTYEVTNRKSLKELKDSYKDAKELILAVDLDREGEAIGWHVAQKLGAIDSKGKVKSGHKVTRIVFSEITKSAIEDAVNHPRDINMDLVNAQQARRFLDRLVGYKLSPILWKKIQFGLSAGRVQSVALRLVVEKETERDAFNSEEYWSLKILASEKQGKLKINYNLKKEGDSDEETDKSEDNENLIPFELSKINSKKPELKKQADVERIIEKVEKANLQIDNVEKKVSKRYPKPPFITSTLQQAAVNLYGMSSKRTMMAAQKLYEMGFITYMRTDSTAMSNQAIDASRKFIQKRFGEKYLPPKPNVYKTKNKSAQEAHECIRPVDFTVEKNTKFNPEQQKIYTLIRNRALSSQMVPAEFETMTVYSNIDKYEFKATGSRIVFDGFLALKSDKIQETILPEIKKGDTYYSHVINATQHFTQPPARYSEATLIKKLEELGIGRPSTYASIISTILSRKYVEKDGRYLIPTDVGKVVVSLLVKYFNDVVDYGFTSQMENNLDEVAEGKLDWVKMLKDFYFPFENQIVTKDKEIPRDEFTVLADAPEDIKCPECGSAMVVKLSRYGKFYSCTKYPECKGMLSIDGETKEEVEQEAQTKEFQEQYLPAPKTEDGRDFLLKKGKFGKFWAHPDYPKVKDARPLEYTDQKKKELFGDAPKTDDGRDYLLRSGKFGYFWAHPDYPKVKDIKKVKKKEAS